ncbi:MAG TPA: UbiD family decarboxylase [Clostridia bacterium]|nr:UbiD family decarboxylase [Clostridia bacterium]
MSEAVVGFREQIKYLESRGWLRRVKREVSPVFEISALAKKLENGPALLFENVKDSTMPLVVNTDFSRECIAACLGVNPFELTEKFKKALECPVPPIKVSDGPIREVIKKGGFDLTKDLPVPVHYEKDAGPYITSGLVIVEVPQRGIRNVSYHRLQVAGPNELRLLIQPRHLYQIFREAEAEGRPLDVAVVIGSDTALRLAGATWGSKVPLGMDELAIAGGLRGVPYHITKCDSVDIWVPSDAEIVLEGKILPGKREKEGPFAEFTGCYGETWMNPVMEVVAMMHRREPIYQDLLTFSPEHHLLLSIPYEPVVLETVRSYVPGVRAVNITPGGCGKFHVVVSLEKQHEGDAKDAILATFCSVRDIKLVIVVDEDINPFDMRDVEWAVATRFQADRDLVIIEGAKGNELDPSCPELALTAKLGLDATKTLSRRERYQKASIPGLKELRVQDYLDL